MCKHEGDYSVAICMMRVTLTERSGENALANDVVESAPTNIGTDEAAKAG